MSIWLPKHQSQECSQGLSQGDLAVTRQGKGRAPPACLCAWTAPCMWLGHQGSVWWETSRSAAEAWLCLVDLWSGQVSSVSEPHRRPCTPRGMMQVICREPFPGPACLPQFAGQGFRKGEKLTQIMGNGSLVRIQCLLTFLSSTDVFCVPKCSVSLWAWGYHSGCGST